MVIVGAVDKTRPSSHMFSRLLCDDFIATRRVFLLDSDVALKIKSFKFQVAQAIEHKTWSFTFTTRVHIVYKALSTYFNPLMLCLSPSSEIFDLRQTSKTL